MAIDRARTTRGALAGAVAAGLWAVQQPLDKLVFRSAYDDVELLGKSVTRGPAWYPVGLSLHLQTGALFGAVYAAGAGAVPLPAVARGVLAAMVEHLGLWPLVALSDRFHPARDELPRLSGNRRALWQATWRHLLFGTVLGELERRLNRAAAQEGLDLHATISPNGHGSLDDAVPAGAAGADASPA
ncbi:MAG: hypothetical protein ACJ76S_10115 [Solirubrobacteraceae bacterium]|jgi:hypothetical protein